MTLRSLVFALVLVGTLSLAGVAQAQITPGDAGNGVRVGMLSQSNSGQVGEVTLFPRGNSTLVVIKVESEPMGRREPAHIHRGHSVTCEDINPKPAFGLADVVNGSSRTIVQVPMSKLLSGNYTVNVHASAQNLARYVSCGHLYQ